ncbi:transcriptional regulator domain-containing protein [Bradyrhizobium sp. 184]|uniref:transcriptional regulator domain-containing protein n=1 Tax=Bradyrhizobium sp. 184 TaxID=2782653 RepID=UPI0035301D35
MPGADWRSEKAYPDANKAGAADIAWEWLRRNGEYQRDYLALAMSERSDAMPDHFRQQWGLSFRS